MIFVDIYSHWSSLLSSFDDDLLLYIFFALREGSMARVLVYKELIVRGIDVCKK